MLSLEYLSWAARNPIITAVQVLQRISVQISEGGWKQPGKDNHLRGPLYH